MAERKRRRRRIDLRKTLFLLPNMVTLSSVFCGLFAMTLAARADGEDDFYRAALLIIFAMFFDMLDGRVARMTKTQSAFGLQLDSLADVLSFGAAPALLIYHWSLDQYGVMGLVACFVYVGCGAIRLARFNVLAMDPNGAPLAPPKYIVGLPIPGAAGILVSIVVANKAANAAISERGPLILGVTLLLATLMVSNVRFRSFKDIKLNARTLLAVTIVLSSSVLISTQFKPAFVLIWLLSCYIAIGILEWLWQFPKRFIPKTETEAEAEVEVEVDNPEVPD